MTWIEMEQYPPTQGDQGERAREAMPNGEVQLSGRIRRAKDPIRKRAIVDPAINDPEQFLLREHAPRHLRGPDHHQGSVGLKHFEITVVSST